MSERFMSIMPGVEGLDVVRSPHKVIGGVLWCFGANVDGVCVGLPVFSGVVLGAVGARWHNPLRTKKREVEFFWSLWCHRFRNRAIIPMIMAMTTSTRMP